MMKALRYTLEYQLAMAAAWVCATLPYPWAVAIAHRITVLIGTRLGVHQRLLRQLNARYTPTPHSIAVGVWQHLAHTAVDFARVLHHKPCTWRLEGAEFLPQLQQGGLIISAHAAFWEAIRIALRAHQLPEVGLYYRRFNNPHIDARIQQALMAQNAACFHKGIVGTRQLLKHLKQRQLALLLADQRITNAPLLPFMGCDAPTSLVPAEMALRAGVPLVPILVHREGLVNVVRVHPAITPDTPEAMMRQFHALLEAYIQQYPQQWFWLHARWGKKRFT